MRSEREEERLGMDETGLTRNRKGNEFFEVQCSNLSFVPVIVQHLPQFISVKLPSSLIPTINKDTSLLIS